MDLVVQFDCVTQGRAGPAACGIVVIDAQTARTVHEAGYYLGESPTPQVAQFETLSRSLDLAASLAPDRLDLRCANELLIRQVTGASPINDEREQSLFEQMVVALLRFDSWQIGLMGEEDDRRPAELAERALTEAGEVVELHHEQAKTEQHESHTGVPQWTVRLMEPPGAGCPARCKAGVAYPLGPDTPAGLCVHAAQVAITDGPLYWADDQQQRMTSVCPVCEVPLQIDRISRTP